MHQAGLQHIGSAYATLNCKGIRMSLQLRYFLL